MNEDGLSNLVPTSGTETTQLPVKDAAKNSSNTNPKIQDKPTVTDVINYATDITPHRLLSIWAGIGSGKNYFAEQFITGNEAAGIPRMIVLIITSRKNKVLEALSANAEALTDIIDDDRTIEDIIVNTSFKTKEFRRTVKDDHGLAYCVHQRSAICTNAFIETYLKYCYLPDDPTTHLWNRFDAIIFDEAHSLHTDSSYQSSPYHVMELMRETYRRMKLSDNDPDVALPACKHLIFMSGTPEAIENIPILKKSPILELRQTCINVTPANIHFITSSQSALQIRQQLQEGERIVFFANHTVLPDEISDKYDIVSDRIAVSFSKEEKRKIFEEKFKDAAPSAGRSENDYERMVAVEDYLTKHSAIRPDIDLFVTTSRNKEGINIKDTDIRHVYIESHVMTDIKQMAGRIRNGAEHVYIITDSVGYNNTEYRYEYLLAKQFTGKRGVDKLSQFNANFEEFCKICKIKNLAMNPKASLNAYDESIPEIGQYIDRLKKVSPYIEYNYFSNEFRYNGYRKNSFDYIRRELDRFDKAAEDPDKLVELFRTEFPESKIHPYLSPECEAEKCVQNYLTQHPTELHPIEEIDALAKQLSILLGKPKRNKADPAAKTIPRNHYFRMVGYECKRRNNKADSKYYNFFKIIPLEASETA